MRSISFVRLTDADNHLAQQAAIIYEASFPPSDRDPIERLAEMVQQSTGDSMDNEAIFRYCLGVSAEQVLALSIYTYYPQQRLGYLWYLATAKKYRNQGLGSWMFTSTIEKIRAEALEPSLGVCWEVERPSDAVDSNLRQISERRIRFYEKNGSILLSQVKLLTPASTPGFPDVNYHLMYYPIEDEPGVSSARIRSLIDLILLQGYKVDTASIYYQQAIRSIDSIP